MKLHAGVPTTHHPLKTVKLTLLGFLILDFRRGKYPKESSLHY